MPVIDPDGLFDGERIRSCSDRAQNWYPRIYCFANNFGRFLLDPDAIILRCFSSYDMKPTRDEVLGVIGELIENCLAYPFPVNDQIWIQLATDPKYLLRHKSKHDLRSPEPPAEITAAFESGYERWKETHRSKTLKAFSEKYPVFSENLFTSAQVVPKKEPIFQSNSAKVCQGVGDGDGDGVGGRCRKPNGAATPSSADADTHTQSLSHKKPNDTIRAQIDSELDGFFDTWNEHCGKLAKVHERTPERKKLLRARIRDGLILDKFRAAVIRAAATPRCCGDNKDNWLVTFDWLVKSGNNIAQVLEGSFGKAKSVVSERPRTYKDLVRGNDERR